MVDDIEKEFVRELVQTLRWTLYLSNFGSHWETVVGRSGCCGKPKVEVACLRSTVPQMLCNNLGMKAIGASSSNQMLATRSREDEAVIRDRTAPASLLEGIFIRVGSKRTAC
jgi:hypothetical protein